MFGTSSRPASLATLRGTSPGARVVYAYAREVDQTRRSMAGGAPTITRDEARGRAGHAENGRCEACALTRGRYWESPLNGPSRKVSASARP